MSDKQLQVKEGKVNIEITGLTNYDEVKKFLDGYIEKYKDLVVTEDNVKEMQDVVDNELKKLRTPIKKYRTDINKSLQAESKSYLDKVDTLTQSITNVIKPIQTAIDKFKEEDNAKKLKVKKEATQALLIDVNEQIAQMEAHLLNFNQIEFQDEWATWSIERIEKAIQEAYEVEYRKHKDATTRLKLAELKCKELKSDYELETDINYIAVLGVTIYENDNWETDLEAEAEKLQIQQEELRERLEDRIRAEERAKIEQEAKINSTITQLENEPEKFVDSVEKQLDKELNEPNKINGKTWDFQLDVFNCTLEKANMLKEFMDKNNFEFDLKHKIGGNK